jgi:hypothetical protein
MGAAGIAQDLTMDLAGSGGTSLVDVLPFVRGPEGIAKTGVRQDQFMDASAGTFTFTLNNYNGPFTPSTRTGFPSTTLSSNSSLGATSISTVGYIPAGSYIVIDTGAGAEIAQTGTPTGSGPYTIPIAYSVFPSSSLLNAHSSGAAVVPLVPLTERMPVCWSSGGQLREGAVLTIVPNDDNWSLLTVTCDDQLGAASRNTPVGNIAYAASAATAYAFWPMNEAISATQALEVTGNANPLPYGPGLTPGGAGVTLLTGETQATALAGYSETAPNRTVSLPLPAGVLGYMGCWITVNQLTYGALNGINVVYTFTTASGVGTPGFSLAASSTGYPMLSAGNVTVQVVAGVANYFVLGMTYVGTTVTYTLYQNGASVGTSTATVSSPPSVANSLGLQISGLGAAGDSISISHVSYSPVMIHEEAIGNTTEPIRLGLIAQTTPQISLATLPAALSTAPIGAASYSGSAVLDMLNQEMRTEQGYIDCVTSGTIIAPAQQIRVRERARPATVSYYFDAQQEILSSSGSTPIPFVRDPTNLIWSDAITGSNGSSQTVSQPALESRAGGTNATDTVDTYLPSDLYEYGSDRLWRGANLSLHPTSITIDNRQCPTDRSAALLAMVPGDRIEINNIPNGALGFTTWDGWLLDKDQLHTWGPTAQDLFTLYLQPCQPFTGIFDTDLFANGGNNLLTTTLTAAATSMVVGSVDGVTWFNQTGPYYLLIDYEIVEVSSAAAPSAGTQTLTIARAQNSTYAGTHAIGAVPEIVDNSSDVATNPVFAF